MDGPGSCTSGGSCSSSSIPQAAPCTIAGPTAAVPGESLTSPWPNPPHVVGGPEVDFRIIIPTRGRWRSASALSSERSLKDENQPFILVKTLRLLKRQGIPPSRVSLWTADDEERAHYERTLRQDPYWAKGETQVLVGKPGILEQRNHIVRALPEGAYVVSLDDDISELLWKSSAEQVLTSVPVGGLERIIMHGHDLMRKYKAWIWGLSASSNPMSMWLDGISTRNGEINGFLYGFINRHDEALLPRVASATEDAERSLRYFAKDKRVLRYRMYTAKTKCFGFGGGLQDLFSGDCLNEKNIARKEAERTAAATLHEMFPQQTLPPKKSKGVATLEVKFRSMGGPPVPTSTVAAMKAAITVQERVVEKRRQAVKEGGRPALMAALRARSRQLASAVVSEGGKPELAAEPEAVQPQLDAKKLRAAGLTSNTKNSGGPGDPSLRSVTTKREDALDPGLGFGAPHLAEATAPEWASVPVLFIGDSSDEEHEKDEQEEEEALGADENSQFVKVIEQAMFAGAAAAEGSREEVAVLRQAVEDSIKDVEIQIQELQQWAGLPRDQIAEVLRESQQLYKHQEQERRKQEEELLEAFKKRRTEVTSPELDALTDLGFGRREASMALADANGCVNTAATMLFSAALEANEPAATASTLATALDDGPIETHSQGGDL